HLLLKRLAERGDWALGEAWVPTDDGAALRLIEAWCRHESLSAYIAAGRTMTLPPGVGLPGKAWATRGPVWLSDATAVGVLTRDEPTQRVRLRAAVVVPVFAGADVVALLAFYATERRERDDDSVAFIAAAALELGELIRRRRTEQLLTEREA